jgi:two-component system, sensor histidine kinase and response regulator
MTESRILKRWRDVSIRTRLFIKFTALIVVFSSYNFLFFPGELARTEESAFHSRAGTVAELVAGNVSTAQFFADTAVAAEVVGVAMRNEDVVYIEIRDLSGALFLSQRRTQAPLSPGQEPYIVIRPVVHEARDIGVVRLGISLDRATERIGRIRTVAAGQGIAMLLVGALLVFGVSTAITRPLGDMVLTAGRIASGNHALRVNVDRHDEVGHLGSAINVMLDALNGAEKKLIELSLHLEERVTDRTTALEHVNASLLGEVRERERIEESLRTSKALAEEASRAKGDFLANMSHEIRTPMNGIIGMTDLALRTDLTLQQKKYLGTVRSSAEALLVVINDILDFSKIEAGKMMLEEVEFDLRETVGDVVKAMDVLTRGRPVQLMCDISSNVPQVLRGDPGRLAQILNNLIGNALKFTEQGEVILRVRDELRSQNQAVVTFSVIDSGVGIPAEKLKTIFEPFTQADLSTTRKYGGTGLGLTICSRLLHLMGGTILAGSTVGEGSTFTFTVPFGVGVGSTDGPGGNEKHKGPVRVAVADPSPTNRKILVEMIRQWHMSPIEVASPLTLPDSLVSAGLSGEPVALVIMDSQVPDGGCMELVRKIRRISPVSHPRFLVITPAPGDAGECPDQSDPDVKFIERPYKQSELLEAIQSVLGSAVLHPEAGRSGEVPGVSGRPLNILLAEDHLVNQELVMGILELEGHAVTLAQNGKEALDLIQNAEFDMVLMDVQMPEMDGYQATAAIRDLERHTGLHMPVIAITAHAMKGDRERCLAAGMDDYISKPIRVPALQSVLRRVQAGRGDPDPAVVHDAAPSPEPAADTKELFDAQEALRQCLGSGDLLRRVIRSFLDSVPGCRQALQDAFAAGNLAALAKAAHSLKGASGSIAANRCHSAAFALERSAKGGNEVQSREGLERLGNELDALEAALNGGTH